MEGAPPANIPIFSQPPSEDGRTESDRTHISIGGQEDPTVRPETPGYTPHESAPEPTPSLYPPPARPSDMNNRRGAQSAQTDSLIGTSPDHPICIYSAPEKLPPTPVPMVARSAAPAEVGRAEGEQGAARTRCVIPFHKFSDGGDEPLVTHKRPDRTHTNAFLP